MNSQPQIKLIVGDYCLGGICVASGHGSSFERNDKRNRMGFYSGNWFLLEPDVERGAL